MGAPSRGKEGSTWGRRGCKTISPVLIDELPSEFSFGGLGKILSAREPLEVRLEAHRIPQARALELLEKARTAAEVELAGGDSHGATRSQLSVEAAGATELGQLIAQRAQELWKVGLVFESFGRNPREAERHQASLMRRLRGLGFRPRLPTFSVAAALSPGGSTSEERRPRGFWHTLHTDGLAAFFPFVEESVAESRGILVGLLLQDASPIFLNRWRHASHSWGVFGTTGSGKSFAAALWILRTLWMDPEVDIVILDPLGEFEALARVLGGSVLSPGDLSGGRFNPLDPMSASGDRTEKASRVAQVLRALFPSLQDEEAATLDSAISRLYDRGPDVPVWSDLLNEVETSGAAAGRIPALLEVFRSGSLRHLNGPTTTDFGRSPVVVNLRGVSDHQLAFHLAYLLDALYVRVRDRPGPKLILVDEAHLLVRQEACAQFFDRTIRHLRHFEAGALLLSQSPDDFLSTESGRSILRNLRGTFLFRLPNASADCREFFGLSETEAEWLPRARLPREAGYSEGLLKWGNSHFPLGVVASTPEFEFLQTALTHRSQPE